jgi:hypothetical protein
MGGGSYSSVDRHTRATEHGFYTKSTNEIFSQRSINNAMSPFGVAVRESRDSNEHPSSRAIIIALDLTGSMGSVPDHLVKDGLPNIMATIIQRGLKDPQLLFLGVGDHECDKAPLQVGQFESSDELLDKWLTTVWLEGGGGGNAGESYALAWYFAAQHTSIDCFEKRNEKGFLFTIGDEPVLNYYPATMLKNLMGDGQYEEYSAKVLLDKAREKYQVFHLHIKETNSGCRRAVIDDWRQLLSDNLIVVESHRDVSRLIAETIIKYSGEPVTNTTDNKSESKPDNNKQKITL